MRLAHNYYYFTSALTPKQCDDIIRMGETTMEELVAAGGTPTASITDGVDKYRRDTHVSFLDEEELYALIQPMIQHANAAADWNFDWDFTEPAQYTKYGKDQFYGWHSDSKPVRHPADAHPNYANKIRKLSVTVNLSGSEDYEGGNLQFDLGPQAGDDRIHTCEEIRPRGSVIVFPSHVQHRVTPVTSGTRRSLVMWSLGPPFR